MADVRTYHLWRNDFDVQPYMRFACDVTEDPNAEDGYRITDVDTAVADGGFMDRLARTMTMPLMVDVSLDAPTGEIRDGVRQAGPGEPGHFAEAIRTVPGAVIRSTGRA